MGTLIMAGQLILGLAILVSLHEWGHYIAARAFGIRVEKFYIFFDAWGVKLFSKKVNDTEWGIGWLPLGGYVKISGMIDESMDKEQMASEPQDFEFRSKPAWQRLIVMIGGVTVNFVLGILIFALSLWHFGDKWLPSTAVNANGIHPSEIGLEAGFEAGDKIVSLNGESYEQFRKYLDPDHFIDGDSKPVFTVDRNGEMVNVAIPDALKKKVVESKGLGLFTKRSQAFIGEVRTKEAKRAGFKAGDRITSIDGTAIQFFDEMREELLKHKGQEVAVGLERDGASLSVNHTLDTTGAIGLVMDTKTEFEDQLIKTEYGFIAAFPAGTKRGMAALSVNLKAFGQMFKGEVNPVKTVSGPFQIAAIYGSKWNWERFWSITGMLSFILAFMNILPIPALDGGHVLFLLVEMLRGKPLPEKAMYVFQWIGMIILFGLMGFILFVDGFNVLFK